MVPVIFEMDFLLLAARTRMRSSCLAWSMDCLYTVGNSGGGDGSGEVSDEALGLGGARLACLRDALVRMPWCASKGCTGPYSRGKPVTAKLG